MFCFCGLSWLLMVDKVVAVQYFSLSFVLLPFLLWEIMLDFVCFFFCGHYQGYYSNLEKTSSFCLAQCLIFQFINFWPSSNFLLNIYLYLRWKSWSLWVFYSRVWNSENFAFTNIFAKWSVFQNWSLWVILEALATSFYFERFCQDLFALQVF